MDMSNSTLLLLIVYGLSPLSGAEAKTPNILFAFADDWGRQASIYAKVEGAGGINDLAKTPNFDKLAGRGFSSPMLPSMRHPVRRAAAPCFPVGISGRRVGEPSSRGRSGQENPDLATAS